MNQLRLKEKLCGRHPLRGTRKCISNDCKDNTNFTLSGWSSLRFVSSKETEEAKRQLANERPAQITSILSRYSFSHLQVCSLGTMIYPVKVHSIDVFLYPSPKLQGLKQWRRRRQGRRPVKPSFIFYLQISQLCRFVQSTRYLCQNLLKLTM